MRTLEGKVAVLTGAAGLIGRTTAKALTDAGAAVVLCDLVDPSEEVVSAQIRAQGQRAIYQRADVSRAEDMALLAGLAVAQFGRLDIWINNAMKMIYKRVTELEPEEWDQVHNVCLKGPFLAAKYAIPRMIQNGGGCFVNIASVHALASGPRYGAYSSAKAGLVALTRQIALDYGPQGIRANAILPGLVRDKPFRSRFGRDRTAKHARVYPVGRYGRTSDVASAIIYLASPEAQFINGASLVIDGGMTTQLPDQLF